jgi:hypothetical protein
MPPVFSRLLTWPPGLDTPSPHVLHFCTQGSLDSPRHPADIAETPTRTTRTKEIAAEQSPSLNTLCESIITDTNTCITNNLTYAVPCTPKICWKSNTTPRIQNWSCPGHVLISRSTPDRGCANFGGTPNTIPGAPSAHPGIRGLLLIIHVRVR